MLDRRPKYVTMTEQTFLSHVKKNEQKLYRLAYLILKDVSQAEDAVQELVAKLWKKRDQLHQLGNIEVYFMVAIKNHCYDEIKKTKRRRTHYDNHAKQEKPVVVSPEKSLVAKDVFLQVKNLINELPETQQLVIQLRDIEQLEMKEVEEITGLNSGAIRTNLSRARKTIRGQIKKLHEYGLE